MPPDLMEQITSEDVLGQAYDWVCRQRRHHGEDRDIWQLRWNWDAIRPQLQDDLRAGRYRLQPVRRVRFEEDTIELWCAQDALVLKATAIVLTEHLKPHLSRRCFHLAGNGGAKAAVRGGSSSFMRILFNQGALVPLRRYLAGHSVNREGLSTWRKWV